MAGKGTIRVSQFSSTPLPARSRAPGRIAGLASLQSCGRGEPSPSTSRLVASVPEQSWSTPSSGRVGDAGADPRVGVVAVGGPAHAVAVGVALDLLARAAGVAVVADRGVVPGAALDQLGAAVAGDDVVVAGAALEDVDPAARRTGRRSRPRRRRGRAGVTFGADRGDVIAAAEVEEHRA